MCKFCDHIKGWRDDFIAGKVCDALIEEWYDLFGELLFVDPDGHSDESDSESDQACASSTVNAKSSDAVDSEPL